jgi:hypothetical protein
MLSRGNSYRYDHKPSFADVNVTLTATGKTCITDISGGYKTGTADSGTYTVTFALNGYYPKTVSGIVLSNGLLTSLNEQLQRCRILHFPAWSPIALPAFPRGAEIWYRNAQFDYKTQTDSSGIFSIPGFYDGLYEVSVGKWDTGHIAACSRFPCMRC